MPLIEVSQLFCSDCVQRERARGSSQPEAERWCRGQEPMPGWPGDSSFVPREQPYALDAPVPYEDDDEEQEESRKPVVEVQPAGLPFRAGAPSDLTRWGGSSLGTGTVPTRDPRTEGYLWAKEVSANGQDPSKDKGSWAEHARRMGFADDSINKGWAAIQRKYKGKGKKIPVLSDLKKVFGGLQLAEFSGQPYGGYYIQWPHAWKQRMPRMDGAGPSWPFRSKSAEKVYAKMQQIIAAARKKNLNLDPTGILRSAFSKAGVEPAEFTPEDDAIMSLAMQWEIAGKDATASPPVVATARSAWGMKGSQNQAGRSLPGRGP